MDEEKEIRLTVTLREFHTILAALRLWQETANRGEEWMNEIATDNGEVKALDDEEIEGLCDRINTTEEPKGDNSHEVLLQIQELLDGVEWTPDTLGQIALLVEENGYLVRDLDDKEAK